MHTGSENVDIDGLWYISSHFYLTFVWKITAITIGRWQWFHISHLFCCIHERDKLYDVWFYDISTKTVSDVSMPNKRDIQPSLTIVNFPTQPHWSQILCGLLRKMTVHIQFKSSSLSSVNCILHAYACDTCAHKHIHTAWSHSTPNIECQFAQWSHHSNLYFHWHDNILD